MGAIKSNGKTGVVSGTQEETAGAQASFGETGSGSDRCRFLFGLCKKTADQFLLTDEKKQDSYIGIEDAGHMVWLLADCRQGQMTQRPQRQPMLRRSLTGIIHRRL